MIDARTGVHELWVVDPEGEEVRVYDLREHPDLPKVTLRSSDALKTSLLPGFEISVKKRSSSAFDDIDQVPRLNWRVFLQASNAIAEPSPED